MGSFNSSKDLCINPNASSLVTVTDVFQFFSQADIRCTAELVGILSGGAIVLCTIATLCVCCCAKQRSRRGRRTIQTEDGQSEYEKNRCNVTEPIQEDEEGVALNSVASAGGGPVYEQPIESSIRTESLSKHHPVTPDLPKPRPVTPDPPKQAQYSVPLNRRPHATSSPAPNSPYLAPPPPIDHPPHTNSFTVNTFMLRKSVAPGPQSTEEGMLFPYSAVDFDGAFDKPQPQPVKYAQVRVHAQGEEMMYEQVH